MRGEGGTQRELLSMATSMALVWERREDSLGMRLLQQ